MATAAAERRFQDALALDKSGCAGQPGSIYREILRKNPNHAGASHLLGKIAAVAAPSDPTEVLPNATTD